MSLRSYILTLLFLFTVIANDVYASDAAPDFQDSQGPEPVDSSAMRLVELNTELFAILERDKITDASVELAGNIEKVISGGKITDTLLLSDSHYALGHYYLGANNYRMASENFALSSSFRERAGVTDRRYALGLTNEAIALFSAGDYSRAYLKGQRGLEARRRVSVSDSSALAANYLNLGSICLEMNDTEEAIKLAEAGLVIAKTYPEIVGPRVKADLYQVIGLSLYRTSEYTKSLFYCREALRLYELDKEGSVESRLLIMNTISQLYRRLDQPDEAEKSFRLGLSIRGTGNIQNKYFLYINYADFLAESGRIAEGEKTLNEGISDVRKEFGSDSREYCMMLASAGEFVNRTTGNPERALEIYDECFPYLDNHPWDVSMKKFIHVKYAETLFDAGLYSKVLEVSDETALSFTTGKRGAQAADSGTGYSEDDMLLLQVRYRALNALARDSGSTDWHRQAVETGRLLVWIYDRQRLEMSEDESRTSLSANSREIYAGMVDNYAQLYELNRDRESLEGLFEFSERGKVAGFLASMREINAAKFSLPGELVDLDNELRRDIGLYRELINSELAKAMPDTLRLATWENVTFRLLRSRDSLVQIFEDKYPSYFNLRYSNEVTPLRDIRKVIGRKSNLLSYVLTNEKLFIFVTNSRKTEVIISETDPAFFSSLIRFRTILSTMPSTTGVRQPFNEFMDLALDLYRVLLEPAVPYLKGDKIIISPDNILSYLPFEALITEEFRSTGLLYREAPFALKKYRFSYIYSVTLSSETQERSRSLRNDLVAFAPDYDGREIDDSLLTAWPNLRGAVRSLPYALLESEDAVEQCGGKAFLGAEATEDSYKTEARFYKIIHLAMHTLVNDEYPAYSKMIFSVSPDGKNDGMLNTYEVYSVPVTAMMVVLSSCNTGVGKLVSGEGILSLARGFLYAGSRSVVMSMWSVEDKSASAVVRSFYKNLRSGQTKSTALRNARLRFLRSADQGRSHPYYWSAMVIYGDDTPLWFNRFKLYTSLLLFLGVVAALVAAVYRGPRS
ncbi:MAG: CHAT domain-containing tetratricopeptide repeat protein [Bacteroidales bacterium]